MGTDKTIKLVLDHLKKGRVLGTTLDAATSTRRSQALVSPRNHRTVLKYRSYDPALSKQDFLDILPQRIFSDTATSHGEVEKFHLLKVRDPKYFQFQDQYMLLFENIRGLREYYNSTRTAHLNRTRVQFTPMSNSSSLKTNYTRYVANLLAAYCSPQEYFKHVNLGHPSASTSIQDLHNRIRDAESKSALVWNLPLAWKPYDIANRFWFYDIKHCFKMYWDENLSYKTLHYLAFNNPTDCIKFCRNFHGVVLDTPKTPPLLVESLA